MEVFYSRDELTDAVGSGGEVMQDVIAYLTD